MEAVPATTDAVDEGFELAGRWERNGEARFRSCACCCADWGRRLTYGAGFSRLASDSQPPAGTGCAQNVSISRM